MHLLLDRCLSLTSPLIQAGGSFRKGNQRVVPQYDWTGNKCTDLRCAEVQNLRCSIRDMAPVAEACTASGRAFAAAATEVDAGRGVDHPKLRSLTNCLRAHRSLHPVLDCDSCTQAFTIGISIASASGRNSLAQHENEHSTLLLSR